MQKYFNSRRTRSWPRLALIVFVALRLQTLFPDSHLSAVSLIISTGEEYAVGAVDEIGAADVRRKRWLKLTLIEFGGGRAAKLTTDYLILQRNF
ncbi:hypothetical protein CJF32_00010015 [Rutstroemia sp. NJR-2017a WRK4]|nr:hypothetical protein CJF32_00010015 [Rutstroemia sp. NJR-2017a WRK4]